MEVFQRLFFNEFRQLRSRLPAPLFGNGWNEMAVYSVTTLRELAMRCSVPTFMRSDLLVCVLAATKEKQSHRAFR